MPPFVLTSPNVLFSSSAGDGASVLTCAVVADAMVGADATTTLVQLCGELDEETASLVVWALTGLAEYGHRDVRLDLSGLTFCDARGLAALQQAQQLLRAHGGRLVLLRPSPFLQRVAGVCGLAALFETAA